MGALVARYEMWYSGVLLVVAVALLWKVALAVVVALFLQLGWVVLMVGGMVLVIFCAGRTILCS